MKVLLLSRYGRRGASSRVRSYQYLPYLESCGIHITVAPLFGDTYLEHLYSGVRPSGREVLRAYVRRLADLLGSRKFDVLWVEYEVFPWLPAWVEWMIARLGVRYLVDYDDAVFHRYGRHASAVVRALLGRKIDSVMRRASIVLVGNGYLADWARRAGAKRVEYLPTVVDLNRYPASLPASRANLTIGWIGSPSTSKYLELVRGVLGEFCSRNDARLVLVGAGEVELRGVPYEMRAWSEHTEVSDIQGFDVGIMPLPDGPWENGKCGYKLIQYMACGRPVVASPVGVNREIVEVGVNGFLATDDRQWRRALQALSDDRNLVERMGTAGRSKVEKHFCLQVSAPRLAALLREVAGN